MAVLWLKDCDICNVGLCKRMDSLKAEGMSEREAAKIMEAECHEEVGEVIWPAELIRKRYQYHTGKNGRKPPTQSEGNQPLTDGERQTSLLDEDHPGFSVPKKRDTSCGIAMEPEGNSQSIDNFIVLLRKELEFMFTKVSSLKGCTEHIQDSGELTLLFNALDSLSRVTDNLKKEIANEKEVKEVS